MNVRRSVSTHQHRCLRDIASGRAVVVFDADLRRYVQTSANGHGINDVILASKPRGNRRVLCGWHFPSSVIELLQRGLLVDEAARLVPSIEAARQYGRPKPLPVVKRVVKMHRTRAARVQG
jgi:hypothetical protein